MQTKELTWLDIIDAGKLSVSVSPTVARFATPEYPEVCVTLSSDNTDKKIKANASGVIDHLLDYDNQTEDVKLEVLTWNLEIAFVEAANWYLWPDKLKGDDYPPAKRAKFHYDMLSEALGKELLHRAICQINSCHDPSKK